MKILKIKEYKDLELIKECMDYDFIVDVEACTNKMKERVIDFLAGLVFFNGTLEKKNAHQFILKGIANGNYCK